MKELVRRGAPAILGVARRIPAARWRAAGVSLLVLVLAWLLVRSYLDVGEARVPDLAGQPAEEAVRLLTAGGLRTSELAVISDLPAGTVVSHTPGPGARVKAGRLVELLVSARAAARVPRVTGLGREQAEVLIGEGGLVLGAVDRRADPAEPGTVIAQRPPPGSAVVSGSPVAVVVSSGPQPPRRIVPSLGGLDLEAARRALEAAGLGLMDVVPVEAGGLTPGTIADQQPVAGSSVPEGSFVTVYLRAQDPRLVGVPDVVGFSAVRARAVLTAAGLRIREEVVREGVVREIRTVLEQRPGGSHRAFSGTGVFLEVSAGPDVASPAEVLPDRTVPLRFVLPASAGYGPATEVRITVRDSAGEREVLRKRVDPGQEVSAQVNVVGEALVQILIDGVLYLEYQL